MIAWRLHRGKTYLFSFLSQLCCCACLNITLFRNQAKICAEEKAARDEIGALERAAKARTNTMKRNVTDIARVGEEIGKEKQKVNDILDYKETRMLRNESLALCLVSSLQFD